MNGAGRGMRQPRACSLQATGSRAATPRRRLLKDMNSMKDCPVPAVPPRLKAGDRVAIAAPARKISPAELEPALRLLEAWGLEVVLPDHLFDADHQMAGSDEVRARVLQGLLDDPEVKAIFCARGGYGTVRIVDRLDFSRFARSPKWIVGYSDITVLHCHVHSRVNVATMHATMPIDIGPEAVGQHTAATETLRRMLWGETMQYRCRSHPLNRFGTAEGLLVGGNLSILYSLTGSASDVDTEGKILFIEDLDEYLYHVDRMMMNLKRSGRLAGLAGLVVGAMSGMHDNAVGFGRTAEQIVADAVAEYGYPVCFGFPAGHIGDGNCALAMGCRARLGVEGDAELLFAP